MLSIRFRFPAGRYHATPWDRQVNEGIVEWPPHPWRIIRALVSVHYMKMGSEGDEETLKSLTGKLSSLPRYRLPPASLGHTRHYMPLYGEGKSSKIFDTFAAIDKEEQMIISWPDTKLEPGETGLLEDLLDKLTYLGRAESWIEAEIADGEFDHNCKPFSEAADDDGIEIVNVLIPMTDDEYQEWQSQFMARANKKTTAQLRLLPSIIDAICIETPFLKKHGWSQPPGSRWVQYARPSDCFDVNPAFSSAAEDLEKPTVARFAVASQAPPRLTEAISVAERVHQSLVKYSDNAPVFTGRDEDGKPLSNHNHAHILCESNLALGKGRRGEITHVTVYAQKGFSRKERMALDRLTKVWGHGGHDIQMVLLGVGHREDFGGTNADRGEDPVLTASRRWISRTPFVPTRHPKATRAGVPKTDDGGLQIDGPEHDLRRLLRANGLPDPISIRKTTDTDLAGHRTRWLHFRRGRKKGGGKKGTNMGYGFEIEFPEEVRGPIAMGYGAHFGLGLFEPSE